MMIVMKNLILYKVLLFVDWYFLQYVNINTERTHKAKAGLIVANTTVLVRMLLSAITDAETCKWTVFNENWNTMLSA